MSKVEGWKWYYWVTVWFFTLPDWVEYLLSPARDPSWCGWAERLKCRAMGHPEGPIYYNSGGLEPDMRCHQCGEEL